MLGFDRYDKLADAVTDVLALVDRDGVVAYINPAGADMLGHPREVLPGHSVFEVVHPDDLLYARTNLDAIAQLAGSHGPIRLRVTTATGDWRTVELMGSNALDDAELAGIVISGRDITEDLAKRNVDSFDTGRLRRLIDSSGDLLLLLGRDDAIEFVNAAVTPMLGYTPGEVIGRTWLDLVVDEDLEALAEDRIVVRSTPGAAMHSELRLLRADGGTCRVEVHVVNERDNPAIEGIVVTARDVSALRRTQERLAAALAATEVGVLELDDDGCITAANDVLLALVGDDATGLVGQRLELCFAPEDRTAVRAAVEWLATGDESATALEGRWGSEAEHRWVTCRLSAARDADGRILDLTCFVTDITRRKEQEASLRQLNEELARYATHDALTDLPNRFLFSDHLDRAIARVQRSGSQVAVLFCDLDWFKEVNDTLGHSAGDEVLVAASQRLRTHLRPSDVLARFGGDEFAVLADELPSTTEVIALANRLVQAMAEPIPVAGTTVQLGLSVGVALSTPTSTPTTLLQEADRAVYEAKGKGRGRYAFAPRAASVAPAPTAPSTRPFGR